MFPIILAGLMAMNVSAVNMLTWQNGLDRTGQNTNEAILTLENVNKGHFGKHFSQLVDGYVFAQPLYLERVSIPGKGLHNVVFVATQHDSVYAFDADGIEGQNADPLWHASFIDPANGVTTVPIRDIGLFDPPELGILSTPVIDPATATIYMMAKTKEVSAGGVVHVYRLHALDVRTGQEKFGGPVRVEAIVPGAGDATDQGNVAFNAYYQANRASLALISGVVYAGFGTQGDVRPVHGWLIGHDASNLRLTAAFCTTPNGDRGGIWMAGAAPVADENGDLFLTTGNGSFAPGQSSYGDSLVRLTPSGHSIVVSDYFTPFDQEWRHANDVDLGSGGCILLPDMVVGNETRRYLALGGGKEGILYLADRDNLGGYNRELNQVWQEVAGPKSGNWSTPAYFNGRIYMIGFGDVLKVWSVTNGKVSQAPIDSNKVPYGYPGATPFISANGANNAIVWAIQPDGYQSQSPAILHAFNATNVTETLYSSSDMDPRDTPGPAMKFSIPTVVNGKVYIATGFHLDVYGLLGKAEIAVPPENKLLVQGSDLMLSVTATGTPPLRYQWEVDGEPLPGQTNMFLQIPRAKLSDSGRYTVTVANSYGSSESSAAVVTVRAPLVIQMYAGLTLSGNVGEKYAIQFSPNLVTPYWTTLTNLTLTNTTQIWFDLDSTEHVRGFYQTVREF